MTEKVPDEYLVEQLRRALIRKAACKILDRWDDWSGQAQCDAQCEQDSEAGTAYMLARLTEVLEELAATRLNHSTAV